MEFKFFLTKLEQRLGIEYTKQQVELLQDFTVPTICFADPGSGKTHTVVAGLITAELYHGIPGGEIYACSFTNQATNELALRHELVCKKLGMSSKVNFKTLDSLCYKILKDNYDKLGLDRFVTGKSMSIKEMGEFLIERSKELEMHVNANKIRSIVKAIKALNAALIFDRDHVESKAEFIETGMTYEDFTILRYEAYNMNKLMGKVQVSDLALLTLELLEKNESVANEFSRRNKLMVVDEFQDMSLIKLQLLSKLTKNLVVVGDMKQQIFAFNGASQIIVDAYKKYYPNYREVELSKSFRCSNEIADFATRIILPNEQGGENFKGVGAGGQVTLEKGFDIEQLGERIEKEFLENNRTFPKEYMFLFRKNISATPIVEELYRREIPFQLDNFKPADEIPIIKDLVELIYLADMPTDVSRLHILCKIIPEFKTYKYDITNMPLYKIIQKENIPVWDIRYRYKNANIAEEVMKALQTVANQLASGEDVRQLFRSLWRIYDVLYLKDYEKFLEFPATYYTGSVESVIAGKTFKKFINDEREKVAFIADNNAARKGPELLTLHRSKGKEADIVYIVDADEGCIPNLSMLNRRLKMNCTIDCARDIRSERSLVYVGCTRAKEELHIVYRDRLASIFTENAFENLDRVYKSYNPLHNDVESFRTFCG